MFSEMHSTPINLEGSRVCDAYSCFPGNTVQGRDVEQAYLNAKLGGPRTYVTLPEELWTHQMFKMRNPVVRLDNALYGHKQSGAYWHEVCDALDTRPSACHAEDLQVHLGECTPC